MVAYNWLALPVYAHEKLVYQQTKRATYDNFETTIGKVSARRTQICFDFFGKIIFELFFQNNFPNIVQTKMIKAESNLPRRTLLCPGL